MARNLLGGSASQSGYPPSAIDPLTGRPCDPRQLHHQYSVPGSSSRGGPPYSSVNPASGRGGRGGPQVTLSDPLGGTTHMLNPHHTVSNHPAASTRIQVGFGYTVAFAYISLRPLDQFHTYYYNLMEKRASVGSPYESMIFDIEKLKTYLIASCNDHENVQILIQFADARYYILLYLLYTSSDMVYNRFRNFSRLFL